jgi:hypothetical protein
MVSLEALLAAAARSAHWEGLVVHRCAWCKRVADHDGIYREVGGIGNTRVATDGMCPACGREALARISTRAASRPLKAAGGSGPRRETRHERMHASYIAA